MEASFCGRFFLLSFGMDAAEVEFLAEREMVTIIPNFSLDRIYLIGVRPSGLQLPCSLPAGGYGTEVPK